ncbi:hypothetical protein [Aquimarina litoralis]|uniref:hypothetical protein n=1 Tax=Aquimarina litoralis TaxID=584605 RepID=UPI001C585CFA|nr:hypothetical protein [Aquimarina litoralis]MBW1298599.1 hypothetical protein [Aquimarina litoralis]
MAKEHIHMIYKQPQWKHANNIEYIEMDFTSYKSDELIIRHYTEACDMILKRPDKSSRVLVNAKGVIISTKTMRVIKEIGKRTQRGVKKSAIVGTLGITTLMMKIYVSYTGSPVKFFTDREAAIKYLINN